MNILKEIILNLLIKIPAVKNRAKMYHRTGISRDPESFTETYERLTRYAPVKDKRVLELGPGKTIEVILQAKKDGASEIAIVDIEKYLSDREIAENDIDYRIYDGKRIPFSDESFDLIWSNDVYEHIRYPQITIKETYRLLSQGGIAVHTIDLKDHFSYGKNNPDITLHCLKYPEWLWETMTWNRSNYVNRLRASEWIALHKTAGFEILGAHTEDDEYIRDNYKTKKSLKYLLNYSEYDAVAGVIHLIAQK